jgi:hypothetical protein
MPRVVGVSFVGTFSMGFCANLWPNSVIHILVKLVAAPLKKNSSRHDGHFDLVYEFVRNVADYVKPRTMARVSKFLTISHINY